MKSNGVDPIRNETLNILGRLHRTLARAQDDYGHGCEVKVWRVSVVMEIVPIDIFGVQIEVPFAAPQGFREADLEGFRREHLRYGERPQPASRSDSAKEVG